jgi:hypothetical protein
LLALNRFVHWLHDLSGRPYWSLAQHVKSRFGGAKRYIDRFRQATLAAARDASVDGVVCGHIHKADLVELDGLLYCNDGDWVESCTALVEDQAGELSLLKWRPSVAAVTLSATASVSRSSASGACSDSETILETFFGLDKSTLFNHLRSCAGANRSVATVAISSRAVGMSMRSPAANRAR